jgi:hypothetical protein
LSQARRSPTTGPTPETRALYDELRRGGSTQALRDELIALAYSGELRAMQSVLDAVRGLAGVRAAAFADAVPFTVTTPRALRLSGEDRPVADAAPVFQYFVTRDFFEVMGIAMRQGHTFESEFYGRGTRLPPGGVARFPAVISETLARRQLEGKALGRNLVAGKAIYEVIGVVEDVKQRGVLDDDTAAIYLLLPTAQSARYLVTRASQDAAPLLPVLRGTVEQQGVMFASSSSLLSDLINATLVVEKSRALLASAYGLAALFLAAVGLYGLAARLVAERRREIGIRVALGAGRRHVRALVMADAWMIVGIGLMVGLPAAFGAARVTQGLLFGVAPNAPHVLGIAAVTLTFAAVTATLLPAWRANRIDPAVTLRDE